MTVLFLLGINALNIYLVHRAIKERQRIRRRYRNTAMFEQLKRQHTLNMLRGGLW